jgi:POT family proton-dependent oligopeptide transporter
MSSHIEPAKQKTYFGHPAGLFVLFFTEMWERFSYYGMRALLTLYMVSYLIKDPEKANSVFGFNALKHLLETGFGPLESQPLASQLYGLYTGFVYLSPFFGGMIADKVWGQRKTVYVGGALMAIGHFLMAFEQFFLIALMFLVLGNGAFKPNISTQVGELYAPGDQRRDGAFTIFYMGINLGGFFSPLVCGTLGQVYGWHYGFGAAGIGMLLGLGVYHFGRHLLPLDKEQKCKLEGRPSESLGGLYASKVFLSFLAIAVAFFVILIIPAVYKLILILILVAGAVYAISRLNSEDKDRVVALVVVCIATVMFWAVYEQQGNTLQLWADDKTDWVFFGTAIPSTWFQSFNPAMIFMLAPLLDMFWSYRARKGHTSTSIRKMGLGSILCGASFIVMIAAAKVVGDGPEKASLMWLVYSTLITTIGELYLSPIGLSFVTKVAPPRMISMMMGIWLMSAFFGNYLGGYIGTFYEKMPKDMFFLILAGMGVLVGIFFLAMEKRLKKVTGDA